MLLLVGCALLPSCCRFHQGALRVGRFNPFEGWVSSEAVGQDILISGRVDMNRAVDGERCSLGWHKCCPLLRA